MAKEDKSQSLLTIESTVTIDVNGTGKAPSSAEQPPFVFPEDKSKFKIIPNNSSIIKTLTHAKNNTSDTEIYDLLHTPLLSDRNVILHKIENDENKINISESESVIATEKKLSVLKLGVNPKLQTEQLQTVGAFVQKDYHQVERKQELEGHTGMWAITSISSILAIAGIVYAGTILWRRVRIMKYGSRQILTNEEDSPIPDL